MLGGHGGERRPCGCSAAALCIGTPRRAPRVSTARCRALPSSFSHVRLCFGHSRTALSSHCAPGLVYCTTEAAWRWGPRGAGMQGGCVLVHVWGWKFPERARRMAIYRVWWTVLENADAARVEQQEVMQHPSSTNKSKSNNDINRNCMCVATTA